MKKYLFLIIFALISLNIFGQNTFKYEIRANGGLRVGGSTFAEIDSITKQAGKLRIISGNTLQQIAGHLLEADTTTMLAKYAHKVSPVFTGVPKINTDTIATRAYARSYSGSGTVTLLDVQNTIADSLVNYVAVKDTTEVKEGSYVSGYTFQLGMSNKVQYVDSLTRYVTPKQLSDSISANLGSVSGFNPNGGS